MKRSRSASPDSPHETRHEEVKTPASLLDPDELLEVYSTDDPYDAEIVCAALHGLEIRCVMQNERQGGFVGLNLSPIRLLVRAIDFDRALAQVESWARRRRE